jgi:hypothetical protein
LVAVGVTSSLANYSGHFLFVWTLIAIGVTGLFSVILSVHGLWSLPWRRSRIPTTQTSIQGQQSLNREPAPAGDSI